MSFYKFCGSYCAVYFATQETKDGANEEEEKQAENGKKEEERGREPEGEREADKTESEMGTKGFCLHKTLQT